MNQLSSLRIRKPKQATATATASSKPGPVTLKDCLLELIEPQAVEDYYCLHCKAHVAGELKTDFWKLPEVLILHLQRFDFNYDTRTRFKKTNLVGYPLQSLNMAELCPNPEYKDKDGTYDLYGVVNHHGDSTSSGDMTAYVRNPINGQWYNHNDEEYTKMSEQQVVTKDAYMLFYLRRPAKPVPTHKDSTTVCTFSLTGKKFGEMDVYECSTCKLVNGKLCCRACALICHKGHEVTFKRPSTKSFCDCGSGDAGLKCKALPSAPTSTGATSVSVSALGNRS